MKYTIWREKCGELNNEDPSKVKHERFFRWEILSKLIFIVFLEETGEYVIVGFNIFHFWLGINDEGLLKSLGLITMVPTNSSSNFDQSVLPYHFKRHLRYHPNSMNPMVLNLSHSDKIHREPQTYTYTSSIRKYTLIVIY